MSSSSASSDSEALKPSAPQVDERYRCGSLVYTKASLVSLFGWLIWGNVCFNLFESQGGYNILNLYLQDNFHVSNLTVNILFNVIPMLMGTIMTPIVSFKSDRLRSRWGRRIPYILFTAPFLALFAAAIGFSDDIIQFCKATFPEGGMFNPLTVALALIAVMTIGYTFFNEFVNTVYWYLLPDVMPRSFIGRFQGVSNMAGTGTGILVNLYIVPYQLTHIKAIHVGLALLYIIGFGLVCLRVKEGTYPPVEDVGEKTKFTDQVRLYFKECFSHRIFILFYISATLSWMLRGFYPAGIFHLHLDEHQAKIIAYVNTDLSPAEASPATQDTQPAASAPASLPTPADTAPQVPPLILAMTSDGQWIVSGDKDGRLTIWNSADKMPIQAKAIDTQGGAFLAMAITPDNTRAVSARADGTVRIHTITDGQQVAEIQAHADTVRTVVISPDGTRLASGGADHVVKVWDLPTGSCLQTLTGHTDAVNSVAFSSDGNKLVSGGTDTRIIVWDVAAGTPLKTLEGSPGPVYAVCFAPALGEPPPPASSGLILDWIYQAGSFLKQVFSNESLYDVPVEQTSKILAQDGWIISGGRDGETDNVNSRVRIWDLAEGKEFRSLKGHKQAVSNLFYKPDLRLVFSASGDGSVRVWKPWQTPGATADDHSHKSLSGYTHGITSFAVMPEGTKLANASVDGTLHIWNIDRGISLAKGGQRGVFFAIFGLVLAFPLGMLVDRWNPFLITIWCNVIFSITPLLSYFIYHDYIVGLYIEILRNPLGTMIAMASMPMLIMLYPKSKFGQFSSANALVRQFVAAVIGPLGAILMDYLTTKSLDTDCYRYGYIIQFFLQIGSLVALIAVYYYWKKLGGENYVAPGETPAETPQAEPATATSTK